MKRIITEKLIREYSIYLREAEKSRATIEKYIRDLGKLMAFAEGRELTKKLILDYKEMFSKENKYKISSINSYLVAANCFFEYMGWYELKVKVYRIQKDVFCPENKHLNKEEYKKLLQEARVKGKTRLYLILETLACTGMRVSELEFVTVAEVRKGSVEIQNKGKIRRVLLPRKLQKQLLYYIKKEQITAGTVFRTRTGKKVNRGNLWREMKILCKSAGIAPEKVFPHNLRHLFAQCFYKIKRDIAGLANVLGHSSIETTRIYLRDTSEEYRRQLEKLELLESF